MAKEGARGKILSFLIYLGWFIILAVGVGDLFFVPARSIIWFGSLGLIVLVKLRFKKIPNYLNFIFVLSVLALILGEIIGQFFYTFTHYDKFLHFINPLFIAIFFYFAYKEKIKDKRILMFYCIFATTFVMTAWEIFEFLFDAIFKTYLQGVYVFQSGDAFGIEARQKMDVFLDTMLDLISGFLGLIFFAIGYKIKVNKNN